MPHVTLQEESLPTKVGKLSFQTIKKTQTCLSQQWPTMACKWPTRRKSNDWEEKEVLFFGKRWKAFGIPLEGMDHLIPLKWNKKVMVERYE